MNPKHAQYIEAIVEEGSFTAAARRLFISQPSLSQTVKTVERELGTEVFERCDGRPRLTCAGQRYLETARDMMTLERNLLNEISEMKDESRGVMRIGISAQRGISLLPQVLPEFIDRYPNVQVKLVEASSVQLEDMVEKGACDAAFLTTLPTRNLLEYLLVENEQIVLMASRQTHLAARLEPGTEVELSAAAEEPFVNLTPGHSVRVIQDHLTALLNISPRVLFETHNLEAAKLVTAQVKAVMVCPYSHLQGDVRVASLVNLYPLKCHGFERHFYFCHLRKFVLPRYLQDLLSIARSKCRTHRLPPCGG